MHLLYSLLLLSPLLAVESCGSKGSTAEDADARLIAAVKSAAAADVVPSDVESHVGQPALVLTTDPFRRLAFETASVELDPSMESEAQSLQGTDLAYWGRPGDWDNPRVVGIVWQAGGVAELFFDIVFPPG